MFEADVIVIGAGVAGLAAAAELDQAGVRVLVLEAADHIGGRVHTVFADSVPIELGAEFVHGKPAVLTQMIEQNALQLEELDGDDLRSEGGKLASGGDFFSRVMKLLDSLRTEGADRAFTEFLEANKDRFDEQTRASAVEYVSGFHAARIDRISEHALAKSTKAGEKEGSESVYRLLQGYSQITEILRRRLSQGTEVHLNSSVTSIQWSRGHVEVFASSARHTAKAVVITIPLPKWQSLALEPDLPHKRTALEKLAMGAVLRVTLRFDRPWWHEVQDGKAKNLSFLFSHHPDFPTWWRGTSAQPNVLTGWCAGPRAERLSALSNEEICARAVSAIADIFSTPESSVRACVNGTFTHNWQADPFIGGGYSYTHKGGEAAPRVLAQPVEDTIFVAGEATDFSGDNGTVQAGIGSGFRAARELLDAFRD
jgi:monoamine oxidase